MRRVDLIVWQSALLGLILAFSGGYILWQATGWRPVVEADAVRSLLMTIVQSQAGILAIAVSFSLLYVQISVDAYSLRAAPLLMTHTAFRRMVGTYSASLAANSVLALFVTPLPSYLPMFAGAAGIVVFIWGLAALVVYIADVTHIVTPEAIVSELCKQVDPRQFAEAAEQKTRVRSPMLRSFDDTDDDKDSRYVVPASLSDQISVGGNMRMLVDFARRMVSIGDKAALQAALDGLMRLRRGSAGRSSRRPAANAEEIRLRLGKLDRAWAAQSCYIVSALLEIWDTTIQQEDHQAATLVVKALSKLLGHHVTEGSIALTNILEAVVHQHLFVDTSRPAWRWLRPRVIDLISEGAESLEHRHGVGEPPGLEDTFFVLYRIGHDLLEEGLPDLESDGAVFRGMQRLGRYGAATGNATIVANLAEYLGALAKHQRAPLLPTTDLVKDLGCRFVRASNDQKYFGRLLWYGIFEVAHAHNHGEQTARNGRPHDINFRLLDALQDIAIECIRSERLWQYQEALSAMEWLIVDSESTPAYAAACLAQIGAELIKSQKTEWVRFWLDAAMKLVSDQARLGPSVQWEWLCRVTSDLPVSEKTQEARKRLVESLQLTQTKQDEDDDEGQVGNS